MWVLSPGVPPQGQELREQQPPEDWTEGGTSDVRMRPPGPPARGPAFSGRGQCRPGWVTGHSSPGVHPESWRSRCSGNTRVRLRGVPYW